MKPYFIGISGGTASGKTTLCKELYQNLSEIQQSKGPKGDTISKFRLKLDKCILLSMDNFYKGLSKEDHDNAHNYNFDHPNSLDFDAAYEVVQKLMKYEDADIPNYDFATHSRTDVETHLEKSNFILFEGIFALYDKRIRDMMDLKLFVHEDDDIRLSRRK